MVSRGTHCKNKNSHSFNFSIHFNPTAHPSSPSFIWTPAIPVINRALERTFLVAGVGGLGGLGQGISGPACLLSVMSFCGALKNRSEETGHHLSCGFVMDADNAKQPGCSGGRSSEVPSPLLGAKSEGEVPCVACPPARDLPVVATVHLWREPAICPLESTQPPALCRLTVWIL